MKNKMTNKGEVMIRKYTIMALLAGTVLVLSGCTLQSPNGPVPVEPPSAQTSSIQMESFSQTSVNTQLQQVSIYYLILNVSANINKQGGTVRIPMPGWDTTLLVFPPDALNKKKKITVNVTCGYNLDGDKLTYYDFGPEGLTFAVPVELHHSTSAGDYVMSGLSWFDPSDSTWAAQASATIQNGAVVYQLNHFSRYAVLERTATGYEPVDNRGNSNKTHRTKNNQQAK